MSSFGSGLNLSIPQNPFGGGIETRVTYRRQQEQKSEPKEEGEQPPAHGRMQRHPQKKRTRAEAERDERHASDVDKATGSNLAHAACCVSIGDEKKKKKTTPVVHKPIAPSASSHSHVHHDHDTQNIDRYRVYLRKCRDALKGILPEEGRALVRRAYMDSERKTSIAVPETSSNTDGGNHDEEKRRDIEKSKHATNTSETHHSVLFEAADNVPSFEVDTFLFPEEHDVDDLEERGYLAKEFCRHCRTPLFTTTRAAYLRSQRAHDDDDGSDTSEDEEVGDLLPTQLITHSFSAEQISFLCTSLFPSILKQLNHQPPSKLDAPQKHRQNMILDVGSRFGAVVAASAHFVASHNARLHQDGEKAEEKWRVAGVEIDPQMCGYAEKLLAYMMNKNQRTDGKKGKQRSSLNKEQTEQASPVKMSSAEIDCCDILSERGVSQYLEKARIIILNNVFEWFTRSHGIDADAGYRQQYNAWETLKMATKKSGDEGVFLITFPSLEKTLEPVIAHRLLTSNCAHEATQREQNGMNSKPIQDDDTDRVGMAVEEFLKDWVVPVSRSAMSGALWFENWYQTLEELPENTNDIEDKLAALDEIHVYRVGTFSKA